MVKDNTCNQEDCQCMGDVHVIVLNVRDLLHAKVDRL